MFHLGGNDVSIRSSTCEEHPLESVIVGFTSTTGEYDFIYSAAEQRSNLQSSFVERLPRRAASPVAARRITVWLLEDDPHGIDDFWRNGSTGVEIQVNALIRSRHGERYLVRTCSQEDPCGKVDGRMVHASRNRVKVRWFL